MTWSAPTYSRNTRLPNGSSPMVKMAGRMVVELGCWILGVALIAGYLAASAGLENQRKHGIELFDQARAVGRVQQSLGGHTLPVQDLSFPEEPVAVPGPESASVSATDALPIAVLRIASVGLEVPVYPDISELNLNRGAGWISGTAAPNAGGNMAVAAHRDRYFRPLKDIQIGDLLTLESLSDHGEFRVSRIVIVDPDDVTVLDDTSLSTVTLVTCYPFYFIGNAPQRFIVQATAVEQSGHASASDANPVVLPTGEKS